MSRSDTALGHSWAVETNADRERHYDAWANQYDADLMKSGYRVPAVVATVLARYTAPGAGPVLDAGCGTGLQSEALQLAGYGPFVGIDLSDGMLAIARGKGIYAELHKMTLGEPLAFADGQFSTSLSVGCITPGHAPPESFDEIIRVTRKGGLCFFSLRVDAEQLPAYPARVAHHEAAGRWCKRFETPAFFSLPTGEPEIAHKVYAYEII